MAKTTTEQVQNSKDKGIIQNISFKDFIEICSEYKIVESAIKQLIEIANDTDSKPKLRVDIYKWIIEMNVGKPRICNSDPPTAVTLEDVLACFEEPPEPQKGFNKVEVRYVDTKEEIERLEEVKGEIIELQQNNNNTLI